MSKKLALLLSLSVGGVLAVTAWIPQPQPAAQQARLFAASTSPEAKAAKKRELDWAASARVANSSAGYNFDKAKELLAAGEFTKAADEAQHILTFIPYSTDGYEVMMDIAKANEDIEAELRWGKWLAWSFNASGNDKALEKISTRMFGLYPGWNQDEVTLGDWRTSTEKAIKAASKDKQYRLAGHLMNKLLDLNPSDKALNKAYDKLAKKAGTELSGGSFVSDKVRRKSAKWLAKNNAKHAEWDTRWEKKTDHYDVETTMDYAFFETVSAAMDEMNEFYRSVYDFKKKAKRVRLVVHRKRSDFDRFTQKLMGRPIESNSVGGYWVAGANTVAVFDRAGGDPNRTRADLWTTLFHEASHQFMSIKMRKSEAKELITPTWLDEGTASYFEGCIIKADGTILKNNIAVNRLRSWWFLEHSEKRKTLKELVAHIRNTGADENKTLSYEGVYYPYGWALAYFLLNYEEGDRRVSAAITPGEGIPTEHKNVRKAGRLVYRQPYLDYIEHFATEGNKDNDQFYPWEMAVKFFVDDVGDPDIPNWDAFENRWRTFTNSLYGEMLTGPEFADVLQARCRGYILAKDYERARVTAEQADDKRPFDAETYRLLAISNLGEGLEGDAIYWMVRHWESVWQAGNAEDALAAVEWLIENDGKEVVKFYITPTLDTLEQLRKDMELALEDEHPILATLFATHAMQAFQLEFPDILATAVEMSELAGQDLRVWEAAYDKDATSNRKDSTESGALMEVVKYSENGLAIFNPDGAASPGYERTDVSNLMFLKPPYSIRGELEFDGTAALIPIGIDRSGRANSRLVFVELDSGQIALRIQTLAYRVDSSRGDATLIETTVGGVRWDKTDTIRFECNVAIDGTGWYKINDYEPLEWPEEMNEHRVSGGFAVIPTEDTVVLFKKFDVRPNKAFWPVAPSDD